MNNMATIVCQNGERLRIERWVYEAWRNGALTDLMLLYILNRAIDIMIEW